MATLTTLNDTITSEASKGTAYPARPTLTVRNVTSKRLFSWVKISGLPSRPGAVVTSAVLRLFPIEDFASVTFNLKLPTTAWTPSKLKWSNQPSVGATVATKTGAGVKEQPFDIDITSTVQGWVSGGVPNRGVRIETTSTAAAGRSFHSVNAAGTKAKFRPVLLIQVSYAPDKPVDIVPSGGAKVSVPDPTVTWRYNGDGVAPMVAYQFLAFAEGTVEPATFSSRFATFNYNGIVRTGVPTWATRKPLIVDTMFNSGAKVIGCQEANSTSSGDNQPAVIAAGLNAKSGSSGLWQAFIGPNLNVIFVDTAVFAPQWTKTKDKALGDGKYASAMRLKHIASGVEVIFWTTHYLTSSELDKQIKHTKVLTAWLASLRTTYALPLIGGGDLNAKQKIASRPIGMLTTAGQIDVRDLVEPEDITNAAYNSLDSYDPNDMLGYWIDHLFVSGGATPTAVGLRDSGDASDHNLIWADISYGAVPTEIGAPTGDSGEVASSTPQHQLAGVGGDVSFRIRHKSSEGRWSAYSDLQTIGFAAKGTLTITSTETTTDDPSPTTTWDFDGDQTAFRVYYINADTGAVIADSKQQSGDDNQWSPGKPLDVTSTTNILRRVRVWDDVERVTTPGDPAYVEATAGPFAIVPDGEIEAVLYVDATNTFGPVVDVEWPYPETPDGWIVSRRIDDRPWVTFAVEVGDAALGGSRFLYRDVTAPAERALTYRVQPVINNSLGPVTESNPVTIKGQFIWLTDPEDPSWLLPVAGNTPGTWAMGEDSSVVNVVGSDRSTLIHEGLRGYESSISGLFVDGVPQMGGFTAQELLDTSWELKKKPTKVWRLALSNMNIPVIVRNVTPVPQPGSEVTFGFSFDFMQQGENPWEDE